MIKGLKTLTKFLTYSYFTKYKIDKLINKVDLEIYIKYNKLINNKNFFNLLFTNTFNDFKKKINNTLLSKK